MGWDFIVPEFPRPRIIDRFTREVLEGRILPPQIEVEGLKIYRLILRTTLSEGILDFGFEPKIFMIHRLHNPNTRVKYIGKSLIEAAIEIAKVNSCFSLRVNAINNSQGFYSRLGFQVDEMSTYEGFEGILMTLSI